MQVMRNYHPSTVEGDPDSNSNIKKAAQPGMLHTKFVDTFPIKLRNLAPIFFYLLESRFRDGCTFGTISDAIEIAPCPGHWSCRAFACQFCRKADHGGMPRDARQLLLL